ncbi:hypothetical protein [Convivina intestini]|uniref:Uncharacterized protein n=1 Tax=Convivina intestini TaxID=1505726 RepID=A0A2U1DBS8_9LACO|nr:hypothetical protein [Convivina intestini]PVY85002.1 hypothetical protein C7384_10321 [Convivina intestini]CAH1853366.1 hypothetical protein R077811_00675 [Convivina intestini]SDB89467.1 hypothetical protein SAMN05216341_103133 [Leuconostocaceae bacterium R-53105]
MNAKKEMKHSIVVGLAMSALISGGVAVSDEVGLTNFSTVSASADESNDTQVVRYGITNRPLYLDTGSLHAEFPAGTQVARTRDSVWSYYYLTDRYTGNAKEPVYDNRSQYGLVQPEYVEPQGSKEVSIHQPSLTNELANKGGENPTQTLTETPKAGVSYISDVKQKTPTNGGNDVPQDNTNTPSADAPANNTPNDDVPANNTPKANIPSNVVPDNGGHTTPKANDNHVNVPTNSGNNVPKANTNNSSVPVNTKNIQAETNPVVTTKIATNVPAQVESVTGNTSKTSIATSGQKSSNLPVTGKQDKENINLEALVGLTIATVSVFFVYKKN